MQVKSPNVRRKPINQVLISMIDGGRCPLKRLMDTDTMEFYPTMPKEAQPCAVFDNDALDTHYNNK